MHSVGHRSLATNSYRNQQYKYHPSTSLLADVSKHDPSYTHMISYQVQQHGHFRPHGQRSENVSTTYQVDMKLSLSAAEEKNVENRK